jgi:hypothetical protein
MISRLSVPDGMGMAQVMPRGGRMGFLLPSALIVPPENLEISESMNFVSRSCSR